MQIAVAMPGLIDRGIRVRSFDVCDVFGGTGDVMKFDMGASVLSRLLSDSQLASTDLGTLI
ncbi:hypothetical protein ACWGQ9_29465, partial [Streptomyces parvus]